MRNPQQVQEARERHVKMRDEIKRLKGTGMGTAAIQKKLRITPSQYNYYYYTVPKLERDTGRAVTGKELSYEAVVPPATITHVRASASVLTVVESVLRAENLPTDQRIKIALEILSG